VQCRAVEPTKAYSAQVDLQISADCSERPMMMMMMTACWHKTHRSLMR